MKKLIQFTQRISQWNLIYKKYMLPELEIIIMATNKAYEISDTLAKQLTNLEFQNQQQYVVLNSLKSDETNVVKCKLHIFNQISCESIKDQEYKRIKNGISKLIKTQNILILVILDQKEDKSQHLGLHFTEEFDSTQRRTIVVDGKREFKIDKICRTIIKKFEELINIPLVLSYRQMINMRTQLTNTYQPIQVIKRMSGQNIEDYIMLKHRQFLMELVSNLEGTYFIAKESQLNQEKLKYSLKSLVFERILSIWQKEYQRIIKSIDNLPLSYIQEQFKIYDSYTLNGFLPSQCFKSIFQSYLYEIQQEVLLCLQNVKEILTSGIEIILHKHFKYIKFTSQYFNSLKSKIETIYTEFSKLFQIFLNSQIKYIYVSENQFWKINIVNTSLYANRVLIQIKYIGLAYVKKIAENLRESIPRMIGELLINRLIITLNRESFDQLTVYMRTQTILELRIQEQQYFESIKQKLKIVNSIINFFCLKVQSQNLISNINEKVEKYINCTQEIIEVTKVQKIQNKKTFFEKIKQLFRIKKRDKAQRASSVDKKQESMINHQQQPQPISKEQKNQNKKIIRQTQWLVSLNTNKQLPRDRIEYSAQHGFPKGLRNSIWIYICKNKNLPSIQLLLQNQQKSNKIYKQIVKDLNRTPPHKFFAGPAGKSLHDVLVAYSIYNPALGYTQGMNFIVSMLVRVMVGYQEQTIHYIQNSKKNYKLISQQAFIILAYIIQDLGWINIFSMQTPKVTQMCINLDDKIKTTIPKLYQFLQENTLTTHMIFTEAIMTCLTAKTPLQFASRVYDLFLLKGDKIIVDTIVKVLELNQKYLLSFEDPHLVFEFLKNQLFTYTYNTYGTLMFDIFLDL